MEKYQGSKFRPTGKITITHNTYTNEIEYKDEFVPTSSYLEYLDEVYLEQLKTEVRRLKTRLDNEAKEYGECDEIEFNRYLGLLDKVYQLTHDSPKKVAKSGCVQPMKYQVAPQPYLPKPTR